MPDKDTPQGAVFIADNSAPTLYADALMNWSTTGGVVVLTFTEGRGDLHDTTKRNIHVVGRLAMPLSSLDSTIKFLQACQAKAAAGGAPASAVLN